MRIPHQLLMDTLVVEDYRGSGAHGPLYGEPRTIRVSFQTSRSLVVDTHGRSVSITVLVLIRPDDWPVAPESHATSRGIVYRVTESEPMPDGRRPTHYQLAL